MSGREPKWMPLSLAAKFEPMAKDRGVSAVARSKRGFFTQYKSVGGRYAQLDPWWRNRRNNFVKRHMAQVRAHGEKLVDSKGRPTRRHLALIMWAYSPFPAKTLKKMLREYEANPAAPISCDDVVAYHARVDGTGDPEWLSEQAERICSFPLWELEPVLLAALEFDTADDVEGYEEVLDEMPIIVLPDVGGRWEVLDGRHRASAADAMGRETILAWRPVGGGGDLSTEEDEMPYTKNPSPLTKEQIEALGQAYLKGVDISGTPRAQEMARAQAERVAREFDKLRKKVRIEFTDRDPYASFEELQADVVGNGHMWVFTGFSDTPLWSPQVNWMSRAVHDYDHVVANTDFSLPGEIRAYQFTAARAPELEPLYLSEIALQAASSVVLGGVFSEGPQKLVFTDPSVSRIAQQFERNESPEQMEEHIADLMTVWDAAGALKTMTPEQLMQRMGAEGVGFDEALLVVISAILAADKPS